MSTKFYVEKIGFLFWYRFWTWPRRVGLFSRYFEISYTENSSWIV